MAPNLPTASSLEMMPAATVVSEAPFQSFIVFECNSTHTTCFKKFAAVPARERWLVQLRCLEFVSCIADTAARRDVSTLLRADRERPGHEAARPALRRAAIPRDGQANVYAASQPVQLTANAGELIYVVALSSGSMGGAQCGVSGTRQKLG